MATAIVKFDLDVLDFIVELNRITTVKRAVDSLSDIFKRFGFETLVLTGLPTPDQRLEQLVLAKRLPPGWFKLYTERQYVLDDPVARFCRRTVDPFEWSEAPYDPQGEKRAAEVMHTAADFRMPRGLLVPIHGATGYEACVSLSGHYLDLSVRSKAAIHLIALYGFNRIRQLLGPIAPLAKLTAREREVIAWSSQGNSAWRIGEILHLSQRTVEEHLARAYRKLGAKNRTQAVAIAVRERLLDP